ncbi:double-strand break repair protein AddB [Aquabacter cavernae]|uniref:double-strand break repair protein AddB n=1 Tax=Aquabacter cavernae TaxID=2496029 RepID=UPI000F8E7D2A|nr:double-strand break repair protein AddB [Aquabacter cavernae]
MHLFTIAPSTPFLPALAQALLDGTLVPGFAPRGDPFALASATLYLPTRRAGRLFAETLLAATGESAVLLPRIIPLGDVDEDALAFSDLAAPLSAPVAVSPVHRRIALTALVAHWRETMARVEGQEAVAAGPASIVALADELAALFDQMAMGGIPWDRLDTLDLEEHDAYFDRSLAFVRIARAAWSDHLEAHGLVEAAMRRDALVAAEAARLAALGPRAGPVIAAGSTGSLPATARLLGAVARLPLGAVVLPGLDLSMEDAAFAALTDAEDGAPDHPQYNLAHLLGTMGAERRDVVSLGAPASPRVRLLGEAMRQARTSHLWANLSERLPPAAQDAALAGVTLIEAADARDEALCIALVLRESLDHAGMRAALITPDRDLARRVTAELARFGVSIDDSAGEPLSETGAGRLARLVVHAAADGFAPVPLFALLSHPLAAFGLEAADKRAAVAALELIALRGPRPRRGIAGLKEAIAAFDPDALHRLDPRRVLDADAIGQARDLVDRLEAALAPLESGTVPLTARVAGHRAAMEAVARPLDGEDDDPAWAALSLVLDDIAGGAEHGPALDLKDYADMAAPLLSGEMVRPATADALPIRILGPLEARLVALDRVVLGGLVEGSWPPQTRSDPWLSRPMRAALGLDLPERRVGLSAHDFAQAAGVPDLFLTYAGKTEGAQSVPSRFLQRFKTVAGAARWEAARARGETWRAAAAALDRAEPVPRVVQPAPAPPLALRPRRLSVTEIETLLRDPYSIFARHVLGLQPLDPLDALPGGAERGTALHDALGRFAAQYPEALPAEPLEKLLALGRESFARLAVFPAEHALWWARFERVAGWFIEFERRRRPSLRRIAAEVGGSLELPLPGGPFRLTGKADRIDLQRDGRLAVLDYKTGTAPSAAQVRALSPQLPLEAAMAARGAFKDVPAAEVADFFHVELRGGAEPGREKPAIGRGMTAAAVSDEVLGKLVELLAAFDDPAQGYRALAAPQWRGRFGPYDHLARVKEWSLGADGEEGA